MEFLGNLGTRWLGAGAYFRDSTERSVSQARMDDLLATAKNPPSGDGESTSARDGEGTGTGALELRGISKTFLADKEVHTLQEVKLTIREGEFVVFVGPSGCGKSTLLNMIAGFDVPSEGAILL